MSNTDYNPFTHTELIMKKIHNGGILLCAADNDSLNPMTIGWGQLGVVWGKPVFQVLVRPSRYTYSLIEKTKEFAICITDDMQDTISFCGSNSGRDTNKIKECNLTLQPGKNIKTPVINGSKLIYECKVIHFNDLIPGNLDPSVANFYPEGDYHRLYFGEILSCYGSL